MVIFTDSFWEDAHTHTEFQLSEVELDELRDSEPQKEPKSGGLQPSSDGDGLQQEPLKINEKKALHEA